MKIKLINFGLKKSPTRAHYNDAGLDVYAHLGEGSMGQLVGSQQTVKIPLGFGVEIPDGYVGFICPRSGLSSRGITCELSPIDSGYRGQVHAIVTNCGSDRYIVRNGEKIGQLVILPCVMAELVEDLGENRGTGAFGSTGGN